MSTMEADNPYASPHEYDSHHEYDDQPSDVDRVPWKIGAFLLIPLLEVIAQFIFTSDGERAILVGPAFMLVLMIAVFDLISQARLQQSNHPASMRYWFTTGMWLGGVGLFALALSVAWRNELYYIAADVFHWYVEFLGIAFLGVWACSGYSSQVISRAFSKACFAMALVGMAVVTLGAIGVVPAGFGGKPVELFRWRLELGRGYPLIPLIISIAALLYAPRSQRRLPLMPLMTILMLLVCLFFTLKRTQWLLFPVCLVGLFLPKRIMTFAPFLALMAGTILWAFHMVSPTTIPKFIDDAKQMLTYNEDWSVDKTIDTRAAQVDETLRVSAKEWWGHGFGAEIYITTPNGKRVDALHYVHSLYAYYALQFGFFGCLVSFFIFAGVVFGLYLGMDTNPDAQWLVRSALFGIFALAGSGIMMVSIHTTLAGVVLAMAVVGLSRCASPHPLDTFHEHIDDHYEEYHEDNSEEFDEQDADEEESSEESEEEAPAAIEQPVVQPRRIKTDLPDEAHPHYR